MTKDNIILAVGVIVMVAAGVFLGTLHLSPAKTVKNFGDFGSPSYFTSPTMATSSVGIYAPVNLMTNSGSVSYRAVCNTSPTTTNALMLELDATTTVTGLNAGGILVPGNSCYEFKGFTGNVYGLYVTNTATVASIYK